MRRLLLPVVAILSLLTCEFAEAGHGGGGGGGRGGRGGGYHGGNGGYGGYHGGYGGYGYGGYHGGYGGYSGYGYGNYWPAAGIGVGVGYGLYGAGYGYSYPGYYTPSYYYPSTSLYLSPQSSIVPSSYLEIPTAVNGSGGPTQQQLSETAIVHVNVPNDGAQVWLDKTEMPGNGISRKFRTPSLETGKRYSYLVKAKWTDDGGTAREGSQEVELRQGSNIVVDFRGHPQTGN